MNNLFHSVHLPRGTVVVGVTTIKPLEEDEEPVGRCVVLIEGYGVLDSMSM